MASLVCRILTKAHGFDLVCMDTTASRVVWSLVPSTLTPYMVAVREFEKFTGRSLVELALLLEALIHCYMMHLVDAGCSRDY